MVQEQDGAREGDVAVMSGVVLRCVRCLAGSVWVPVLSMIMFWLLRKVWKTRPSVCRSLQCFSHSG